MDQTQKIIDILRAAGLEAYWPGTHESICRSPYCVPHALSGILLSPAGGSVLYRICLYVPADRPEELDSLARSVRQALAPAQKEGWLTLERPRGNIVFDDTFRSAGSSIDYVSYYSEM